MSTLTLTRGLPGSGKSTWARQVVAASPAGQVVRVNRDATRDMLHGPDGVDEVVVTAVCHAAVDAALRSGRDVVCDDTNLRARHLRSLYDLAARAGAEVVEVSFWAVPVDECVRRDAERLTTAELGRRDGARVGEDVIRALALRFAGGLGAVTLRPAPPVPGRYDETAAQDLPQAWLVDIDGTLARMGDRSPYDWSRVGEDTKNVAVHDVVAALRSVGNAVIVMSGRDASCREQTEAWLRRHDVGHVALHMRAEGDTRPDTVVKAELFDAHVRGAYQVRGVLDDRSSVVALWRAMGLPCFQVAPGDF